MDEQKKIDHAAALTRNLILSMIDKIKDSIEHNEWQKQTWASVAALNRTQIRAWEICHEMKLKGYYENE